MRVLAIGALLAGCGRPDGASGPRAAGAAGAATVPVAGSIDAARDAPDARLPDGIAPVAYDLTLEVDPERATFTGRVAIAITAAPGTTRLSLHAVDLDIARAVLRGGGRDEPVGVGAGGGQLRSFALPHPVGPAPVTLVIDYTGRVTDLTGHSGKDQQGLFRERTGGRWYLYSQAESVFARRIVPCFDEPRFKSTWRVRVVAPRDMVALGNAPAVADNVLPDGRREVRFAEIAALPSYLLAIAVGPFELVDAGRFGRGRLPVRFAVAAGDGRRVGLARRDLPALIDAVERYVDAPLPLAKLDFVAVPQFFGAMENPGLITLRASTLLDYREFVEVAAHELAHQWFGDSVTPAWWDQLWLSEAFASWLEHRVSAGLGAAFPLAIAHEARLRAFEADDAIDARALIHPIASSSEVEPAFDALAYDKGAAVLAMFERLVGADHFQVAVRRYLAANAGRAVTSRAFLDALDAASSAEVGRALASNLEHAGTPVVELALRCDAAPAIVGAAQGGVTVPICVRTPSSPPSPSSPRAGDTARACFLVGAHTELPLPPSAGCPAWLVGNDGGLGYYRTVLRGVAPLAAAAMTPEERLARGDDAAIAVRRGELPAGDALDELTALAATREPYGALAALEVARAVDAMVGDAVRPAWTAWLAVRFADQLTRAALIKPRTIEDGRVRHALVELVRDRIDRDTARAARTEFERGKPTRDPRLLPIAAARDAEELFDGVLESAARSRIDEARDAALDALGGFPPPLAPRVVDAVVDGRFPADRVWPALEAMLGRGETRSAAWRAIHARFAEVIAALGPIGARDALAALSVLCEPGARSELATDAAPWLAAIASPGSAGARSTPGGSAESIASPGSAGARSTPGGSAESIADGRRTLDRTLATIDRCIARRAAVGDVAAALARPARSGL